MKRDVYGEDHELYREQFRRFAEKEIAPKIAGWNEAGMPDRETWRRLGEAGFLGSSMPEAYGGAGGDFLYDAIVMEELAWLRAHALMFSLHIDICAPYIRDFGTEDHKRRFLAGAIRGEVLLAVAMTEPGTGSDLANVQTRAIRDGDHYVVNGSKTFISHGQIGDVFIVVCKTDPDAKPPHRGISLLLVEDGTPGFVKGRKLDKLGLPGQDTSELFFQDCRVPVTEPARRGRAGLPDADDRAAAGAALHRCFVDRLMPARARRHHRVREGPAAPSASRSRRSRTRSSSSRNSPPRSRSARSSSTGCWRRTCAATTSSPR